MSPEHNEEEENDKKVQETAEEETDSSPVEDSAPVSSDLEARLVELESELSETKDKMLRAMAEADNTRKRLEKERQDTARFAISSFARDLLTVSDNLRRALEAIPEDARTGNEMLKSIYDGVEATERELVRIFKKSGIEKIEALDKPLDPNFHEVMFEVDSPDKPAGMVVQVVEPGYVIHDRLLRPARVGVSKQQKGTPEPGQTVDEQV